MKLLRVGGGVGKWKMIVSCRREKLIDKRNMEESDNYGKHPKIVLARWIFLLTVRVVSLSSL